MKLHSGITRRRRAIAPLGALALLVGVTTSAHHPAVVWFTTPVPTRATVGTPLTVTAFPR